MPLEKELFENLNLEWGVDIISEDMILADLNADNKRHLLEQLSQLEFQLRL